MFSDWKRKLLNGTIFLVLCTCIYSVINYTENFIVKRNQEEFRRNLQSVLDQNVETTSQILERHVFTVHRIAGHLKYSNYEPQYIRDVIERQRETKDALRFIRAGFIYPDGTAITSDGTKGNLAIREYFQRSMRGETVINPATMTFLGETHEMANVFSTPAYDKDGKIRGVVFYTVPNSLIVDYMNRGVFAEFGSSAVVDDIGNVIATATSSSFQNEDADLLDFVITDSGKHISSWQERLNKEVGQTMFFDRDGGKYLYFAPVDIIGVNTKVSVAIVLNKSTIDAQTHAFAGEIHNLMLVLLGVAIIGAAYFLWDNHRRDKSRTKELEAIAYSSRVTGGPNLDGFIINFKKNERDGYIVHMDIKDFEIIRSICGIEKADDLLRKSWQCILSSLKPGETACHINNDNYGFIYCEAELENVVARLTKLNDSLIALSAAENVPAMVAFYGLMPYKAGQGIEMACSNANFAHFSVMHVHDRIYDVYGEGDTKEILNNKAMEQEFDNNIAEKRFEVWYQPKVDCFTNKIMGAEALIRLRDADGNLVPPYKFIPLFERDGLIRRLDEYVFNSVCAIQRAAIDRGLEIIPISINLSRISLYYADIVEVYEGILQFWDIEPEYVPLEVTESAVDSDKKIRAMVEKFAEHGFKLHLDDFGSGYSSLVLLNELHFDNIKIDKSLVDYIGDSNGNKLLNHIITLAKELGMSITAEGVEHEEQIEFLKSLDCHCIQGYYFSPPLSFEKFDKFFLEHK